VFHLVVRPNPVPATGQAIAVDGRTLRGSRSSSTARHVLAACDQDTSVVLASTDVDGKTNEITRFAPLLDQISDLRGTVITVYAITDMRVHQARPAQLAAWIRRHRHIENQIHWVRDVTYDEDRSQIRTGTGPGVTAALRNAAIGALRITGVTNIAAANRHHARDSTRPLHYSASSDDFAGAPGVHRTTQGRGCGLPGIRAAAAATVARSSLEKPARLSTARDLFVASVHNASSAAS
jgi:hypothetical protein